MDGKKTCKEYSNTGFADKLSNIIEYFGVIGWAFMRYFIQPILCLNIFSALSQCSVVALPFISISTPKYLKLMTFSRVSVVVADVIWIDFLKSVFVMILHFSGLYLSFHRFATAQHSFIDFWRSSDERANRAMSSQYSRIGIFWDPILKPGAIDSFVVIESINILKSVGLSSDP